MKSIFYPFPVVSLIADYRDEAGEHYCQVFQAQSADALAAAHDVYDMLEQRGYTICAVNQILEDCSMSELQQLADVGREPYPPHCPLYVNMHELSKVVEEETNAGPS